MKRNFSEIVCIIDRSGSMASIQDDAIGGFNTFLEAQKKEDGEASLTRVIFDDQYEIIDENKPLDEVEPFTKETYVPRGMTALMDAVGKTITTVAERISNTPEDEKPEKVIFAILTDGAENSSREYDRNKIFEMIKSKKETERWEFIFLAANQDAMLAGTSMGIDAGDTVSFAATGKGTKMAYDSMSLRTSSYRSK
jgi:uncharacterized protein YegL